MLLLLLAVAYIWPSAEAIDMGCTDYFNATKETVNKSMNGNETCIWLIEVHHNISLPVLYVTILQASLQSGQDTIKLYTNRPDTGRVVFQTRHFTPPQVIATSDTREDTKVVSIVVSTGPAAVNRTISFHYDITAPTISLGSAPVTFSSPIYRVDNYSDIINATYSVQAASDQLVALTLSQYNVSAQSGESSSVLVREIGANGELVRNLTFTDVSSLEDVLATKPGHGFEVEAHLSQKTDEGFIADVYPVTRGAKNSLEHAYVCSGAIDVPEMGVIWSTSEEEQQYSNSQLCLFQLRAPKGKRLLISKASANLADTNDKLLVYDGGSSGGLLLGSISQQNAADSSVRFVSSGERVLLKFISDATRSSGGIIVSIRNIDHQGTFLSSGSFSLPPNSFATVEDSGQQFFNLIADSNKQVETWLSVYMWSTDCSVEIKEQRGSQFVTLRRLTLGSSDYKLPVTSQGSTLSVVATGFYGNQSLSGNFSSVTNVSLTTLTADSSTINTQISAPHMWLINPQGADCQATVSFAVCSSAQSAVLTNQLTTTRKQFELELPGPFPTLLLDAAGGLLLTVNVNNTCSVSFTYSCSSACVGTIEDGMVLNTPRYPGSYPRGTSCTWTVPSQSVFTPTVVKLPGNDTLRITETMNDNSTRFLGEFSGSMVELPDLPTSGRLSIELKSKLPSSISSSTPTGGQLSANVKSLDCGGVITNLSSAVSNSPNVSCHWLVQGEKSVLEFTLTLNSSNVNELSLMNGPTAHSQPLRFNSTLKTQRLRTSTRWLTVVYMSQSVEKPLQYNITNTSVVDCPKEDRCKNGICMQSWWRCNGLNDCGDYTDEINCAAAPITSPVAPTKPAPPAPSSHGISPILVAVLIPLCLVLGFAAAWFGPRILRRMRQPSYSRMDVVT